MQNKVQLKFLFFICFILFSSSFYSQIAPVKGLAAIKESDLKKDLYDLAGDYFRGRGFGTVDELKAAVWLAEKMRDAGMKPAGDDSTFFQFFNLKRNKISPLSTISIGSNLLKLWSDILIVQTAQADVNADIIYIGEGTKENIDAAKMEDKIVALIPTYEDVNLNISFATGKFIRNLAGNKYEKLLADKKVKGIIFIAADDFMISGWDNQAHVFLKLGTYKLDDGDETKFPPVASMPMFWMKAKNTDLLKSGNKFKAHVFTETFLYPSVNVIGKIEGTDKNLKNEYVFITSHTDHMGIRESQNGDSIYNGADDNASACVAMLAIGRAYHQQPAKRSQLFISFGSEEPYLFGSYYYVNHPTIKKENIVAVLNADLIGGNNIDSAAILGTLGAHNVSPLLSKWAMEANMEGPKFKIDTLWDKPEHSQNFLYRSDHASFIEQGIPGVFFTTLLESVYHTPKDEPSSINYPKLKKVTDWMYRTSWKVSNNTERPTFNPDFIYKGRKRN
jgi:hypothetical protein